MKVVWIKNLLFGKAAALGCKKLKWGIYESVVKVVAILVINDGRIKAAFENNLLCNV